MRGWHTYRQAWCACVYMYTYVCASIFCMCVCACLRACMHAGGMFACECVFPCPPARACVLVLPGVLAAQWSGRWLLFPPRLQGRPHAPGTGRLPSPPQPPTPPEGRWTPRKGHCIPLRRRSCPPSGVGPDTGGPVHGWSEVIPWVKMVPGCCFCIQNRCADPWAILERGAPTTPGSWFGSEKCHLGGGGT